MVGRVDVWGKREEERKRGYNQLIALQLEGEGREAYSSRTTPYNKRMIVHATRCAGYRSLVCYSTIRSKKIHWA